MRGVQKWPQCTVLQPRGLREGLLQSKSDVSVHTAPHILAPSLQLTKEEACWWGGHPVKTDISSSLLQNSPQKAHHPTCLGAQTPGGGCQVPHKVLCGQFVRVRKRAGVRCGGSEQEQIVPSTGGLQEPNGEEESPVLGPIPILWDAMCTSGALLGNSRSIS